MNFVLRQNLKCLILVVLFPGKKLLNPVKSELFIKIDLILSILMNPIDILLLPVLLPLLNNALVLLQNIQTEKLLNLKQEKVQLLLLMVLSHLLGLNIRFLKKFLILVVVPEMQIVSVNGVLWEC